MRKSEITVTTSEFFLSVFVVKQMNSHYYTNLDFCFVRFELENESNVITPLGHVLN